MAGSGSHAPGGVREGVREGILAAIARDVELQGARTAGRLVSAGVVGAAGAVGAMVLVTTHPFGHHPDWHAVVFSAIWAGLLTISLALTFLQIRTPRMPIGRAAAVGLLGLGFAGVCSLFCPDPHVMEWWLRTAIGSRLAASGSPAISALCFGMGTSFGFAAVASGLLLQGASSSALRTVSAGFVLLLLVPGVILESVGMPWGVLPAWIGGTAAGAYAGIAFGGRIADLVRGFWRKRAGD